jgi:hypothetical protein
VGLAAYLLLGIRHRRAHASQPSRQRDRDPAGSLEREYTQSQSVPRFVRPSEVAELCALLSSPAASMVNGHVIAIDGNTETYHLPTSRQWLERDTLPDRARDQTRTRALVGSYIGRTETSAGQR